MRRIRTILALLIRPVVVALLVVPLGTVVGISPAAAHPSFSSDLAQVDMPLNLNLIVDSHFLTPMVEVAVDVPAGFRLERPEEATGFTLTTEAGRPTWRGSVDPGRFASFNLRGTPERKGVLVFPVTTTSVAGETMRWADGCASVTGARGPLLFVGIDVVTACEPAGAGPSSARAVGLGLVAVGFGVAAFVLIVWRRRRPGSAGGADG